MKDKFERLQKAVGRKFWNEKVHPALRLIECQLKQHTKGTVLLSYNGGKDCTVVLELLELSGLMRLYDIHIASFHEEDGFEVLKDFTAQRIKKYTGKVHWMSSNIKEEMAVLVNSRKIRVVLMGQRKGDPYCPTGSIELSSADWPRFVRINPILEWSYNDVWHFLRTTNAKYCHLYNQGYTSLGPRSETVPHPELGNRPAYLLKDQCSERVGRIGDRQITRKRRKPGIVRYLIRP